MQPSYTVYCLAFSLSLSLSLPPSLHVTLPHHRTRTHTCKGKKDKVCEITSFKESAAAAALSDDPNEPSAAEQCKSMKAESDYGKCYLVPGGFGNPDKWYKSTCGHSPGFIAGIVIGVLVLVGGGAAVALMMGGGAKQVQSTTAP